MSLTKRGKGMLFSVDDDVGDGQNTSSPINAWDATANGDCIRVLLEIVRPPAYKTKALKFRRRKN